MALIIADRVKETTTTTGTGNISLSGRTFGGFQTFAEAIGDGNTTYYCIQNDSQFEIGLGTYNEGANTLNRDTVFQSSNNDNKINIDGIGIVFSVVPADKLVYKDEDDSVVFPTPFIFKRSDDGDYWQALSTDYTNRVASFYIEEGTDPTWKIGLKTSNSEIIAPYYAYVSGKDGFVELRGNASSILSIGDEDAQGLQVNHQLKNIIDIRKNGGEIAIQNLDLNSDETTSAKNNSIAYTVFAVESSAGHAADLQTWSVATDEKASLNQYGDFETAGDIIAPSGRFTAIRFSDGSTQTTAALPFASGALIDQNTTNIVTQSGYFQSVIDSIDSASVSGWAESYIDQTSGNLQAQIDINESNIAIVSGLIGDADFLPGASGGLIDQNIADIVTVSGALRDSINELDSDLTATSGALRDGINQNTADIATASGALRDSINELDSDITTASGALRSSINQTNTDLATASGALRDSINQNTSDIGTVSGLLTPSGESFDFIGNVLTYNNSYGGSFTADLSSLSTFDTSGVSLAYSAGTLTYTNNAGGSFDVDLSSISGDVYAMIVDGAPATLDTLNEIAAALNDDANVANTLTTLIGTTSGNLQSQIADNDTDIATLFTASGDLQSQIDSNDTDIATLFTASGNLQSQIDSNDTDIATLFTASGDLQSQIDSNDTDIATLFTASGNLQSQIDSNDTDIATLFTASGDLQSQIDSNDTDIATVSGLLDSVTPTGTPSGVGFFDNGGSLSGNSSFTYDGANVRLFGNIDVSGISTFGSGVKTPLRTEVDGPTITFDMDQSNNYTAELGGPRTLAVSNVDVGQKFTIRLTQDSVGSRVPTWWGGITWLTSDGSEPTLKTGSGEIDYFGFISTSGGYYEGFHLTEVATGGGGSSTLTVKEADGTPNVSNVSTIVVSNGTLTNDGGGQVTITTGGGGGGSYDDTYISGVSTFASGLAIQNQADIATVSGLLYDDTAISGYFESRVNTNETQITAVSGWAQSYVDSQDHSAAAVSGALQPQITSNDADIAYLSGIAVYGSGQTLQSVTDNGATTTNAIVVSNTLEAETVLADLDGPIILECKNNTASTINAGTPVYVSGYFSANGKALIAPAVGNDPTKMPAIGLVADNLTTGTEGHVHVFGLAAGFDTSAFTVGQTVYVDPTASGLTNVRPTGVNELVQNMGRVLRSDASQGRVLLLGPGRTNDVPNSGSFEILNATTGNFEHMNLTSDDTVPTFTFTGSGVNDTPINLEVRSRLMSATGSGTALLFQGTQGQLFSITDNLSSGTIFNVSDITGLPMLEVTASGDVEIGEFADNITIHQPVLLSGGVPSNTTNKLYNDNGSLYFNGSALGYDDTAISGYFESRVDQADIDIATVSGLLYDDTYISGVATFASGLAITNETNITANSGYFEGNILELVGVSGIDVTSAGSTVNISAGSLSGYFENHHITTAATSSSNNTGSTFIQGVLLDSYGHVTGINTAIAPDTDTTYTAGTGLSLVGTTFNLDFSSAAIVTEAEGISSNDNDTTLPTSAAVKDYVDNNAGGGSSYTAGSGLTLSGTEFNVYGGSGNFENIDLTTDAAVVPKMVFTGSGVTDTPIRMKVLSSHASASTSGTALAFEGTEGQLFGITDNLSSGRIFSVNDITGLPLISVDASGDVELAEFGRDIIAHKAITLQSGVPSVTTNKLYNDGYGLYFNGSAVGGGGGGTTYTAGSGLTLVGTEFNTAGTGVFKEIRFNDNNNTVLISTDTNLPTFDDNSTIIGGLAGGLGSGTYNTFLGQTAGYRINGSQNTFIGSFAGSKSSFSQTREKSTAVGHNALAMGLNNVNGADYFSVLGYEAGYAASGTRSVGVGYKSLYFALGDDNIEIVNDGTNSPLSYNNNGNLLNQSNKLHIGYTILGDTSSKKLAIGNVSFSNINPDATLEILPNAATDTGLIVQGATSQSATLQEWQNSSETKLLAVGPDGGLEIPSNTPSTTTNKLYNVGGTLTFNGSAVGGASLTAGSGITIDGADQINVHGGSGHFINLDVEGAFTATTKSFLIDHPSKEGMRLQYASLEGPENGVYVRGTTDEGFITLPDYWRDLVHNGSITVTLTPVGQFQPLFVEQKNNREIRVGGVCGYYDYVVYGERKDVDKLEVEW